MKFDAIETRVTGATRRRRKGSGQDPRKLADRRVLGVPNALAFTELECLELASVEHRLELVPIEPGEFMAHDGIRTFEVNARP